MNEKKLLLNARSVAGILQLSTRKVWQMNVSGQMPAAIHVGKGCTRWRVEDLERWVQLGCPDLRTTQEQESESC